MCYESCISSYIGYLRRSNMMYGLVSEIDISSIYKFDCYYN